MATIRKRGESYQIIVSNGYDFHGKQIVERTTWKPEAGMTERQKEKALNAFAVNFEEKVKNGKYLPGEKMTVQAFSEKWMTDYVNVNLSVHTREKYQSDLDQIVLPAIGHLKMSRVTPLQLTDLYNRLVSEGGRRDGKPGGLKASSVRRIHSMLSSLFETAEKWMIIESNPCRKATLPKEKKTQELQYFTPEQTKIFLDALDEDYPYTVESSERTSPKGNPYTVSGYTRTRRWELKYKVYFYVAVYGGLRRGEELALRWNDIDYRNQTIRIDESAGPTREGVLVKEPKTPSSIRTISMPESVMKLIKQYREDWLQLRLALGSKWEGSDFIFIGEVGKIMTPSSPYQVMKKIIRGHNKNIRNDGTLSQSEKDRLTLPEIPLHGLRHTCATALLAEGVDPVTVAHRLGHADSGVTLSVYAHYLEKQDQAASESLEKAFCGAG